jgi:hypothetical protein
LFSHKLNFLNCFNIKTQTSELEISQAEEMEDLLVAQKVEEFELLNKQGLAETEVAIAIENQRSEIETAQLFEKQKMAREQMQRAQRKQQSLLSKQQKAAVRARERVSDETRNL